VIGTTGKNNTTGSKRSITYGSSTFAEQLTSYTYTKKDLTIQYVLEQGPVKLTDPVAQFDSYTERLYFSSICGGTATFIVMEASYCGSPEESLYDVYVNVHGDAAKGLATKLGARAFGGSCPVGKS
jgi:hypothetical protein